MIKFPEMKTFAPILQFRSCSGALVAGMAVAFVLLPQASEAKLWPSDTYDTGTVAYDGGYTYGSGSGWADLPWSGAIWWQNRYVTEGRNRAPGSQFMFAEVEGQFGPLTAGAFWAQALSKSAVNRVDLSVGTEFDTYLGAMELGLARVFYPSNTQSHSWEASLGLDFDLQTWFTPFVRTYIDFDDLGGGFLEGGVKAEFDVVPQSVQIEPFALLGVDYGYVDSDNRPEFNNIQLGVEMRWLMDQKFEVFGQFHHSIGLSNLRDRGNRDVTWGGLGVRRTF